MLKGTNAMSWNDTGIGKSEESDLLFVSTSFYYSILWYLDPSMIGCKWAWHTPLLYLPCGSCYITQVASTKPDPKKKKWFLPKAARRVYNEEKKWNKRQLSYDKLISCGSTSGLEQITKNQFIYEMACEKFPV